MKSVCAYKSVVARSEVCRGHANMKCGCVCVCSEGVQNVRVLVWDTREVMEVKCVRVWSGRTWLNISTVGE